VVRIAISQAAFDALASTLALGSVNFENATNERGGSRCARLNATHERLCGVFEQQFGR
jgi:hypothetical protein